MKISKKTISLCLVIFGIVVFYIFAGCPIRFFTGICCPGCGLTRAFGALIKLDFKGAFYYHPMIFLMPVFLVLFIVFRKNKKAMYGTLVVMCAFLILVYIYRMINQSAPEIVYISPEKGIIYDILRRIFLWQ